MSDSSEWLTKDELVTVTGKKWRKLQIAWLKQEGIPFRVNLLGNPIVARVALQGGKPAPAPSQRGWTPKVIGA